MEPLGSEVVVPHQHLHQHRLDLEALVRRGKGHSSRMIQREEPDRAEDRVVGRMKVT